jgi:hypothetical protein
VVDVADPTHPRERGSFTVVGGLRVAVQGTFAYVLVGPSFNENGRVLVIDVSDPTHPRQGGGATLTTRFPGDITVSGRYVYTVSGSPTASSVKTLDIVDIVDPGRPVVVGSARFPGDVGGALGGVAASGFYAYVADSTAGLRVVSVADPTRPVQEGLYTPPGGGAVAVAARGGRVYLGIGRRSDEPLPASVRAVDVSDPTRPVEVTSLVVPRGVSTVRLGEGTLYVADGQGGLRVVDISDPDRLREVAVSTAAERAADVAISGSTLYVADGDGAFWVLRYPDPSPALPPRSYLPLAPQNAALPGVGGPFVSSITVQNVGTIAATVAVQVVHTNGTPAAQAVQARVGPGANQLV